MGAKAFADHLDNVYLNDTRTWPAGGQVVLPENICVAVAALLQYLTEDTKTLPEALIEPATKLATVIGSESYRQNPHNTR